MMHKPDVQTNGTWYDSFLDLVVWVGLPRSVARAVLPAAPTPPLMVAAASTSAAADSAAALPAAASFAVRAISRQQHNFAAPDERWAARYTAAGAASIDPAVNAWCDGIRNVLAQSSSSSPSFGGDAASTASFSAVVGDEIGRRAFVAPCASAPHGGVAASVLLRPEAFVPVDEAGAMTHGAATAAAAAATTTQRNVSGVVSLIVDGPASRLAREVFGANANAVLAILASLGLADAPAGAAAAATVGGSGSGDAAGGGSIAARIAGGGTAAPVASSTVNGLLWTTLGTPQLQRAVILQAAFFYVLRKTCGVQFAVDEATGRWRCAVPGGAGAGGGSASGALAMSSFDATIASVLSSLLALIALDETTWYLFPASRECAPVANLLLVLSVLGFVALARNGPGGRDMFRVSPELRDAALIRGAVDLVDSTAAYSPGARGGRHRRAAGGGAAGSGALQQLDQHHRALATTDCVVVETNFRVYVHLVPVRGGAPLHALQVSHRGETLLSVLRTFLDQDELVLPVFAVFRLTRDSFLRALRRGLTADAIIRFLEAKSHPMAVAHYGAVAASTNAAGAIGGGVPKALKDQMVAWGREAERIALRPHHVLLTFPTAGAAARMLQLIAQRCGVQLPPHHHHQHAGNNAAAGGGDLRSLKEEMEHALPAVLVTSEFQIVLPEKMWPLVADLLPE